MSSATNGHHRELPSSLQGPPDCSLVPADECQLHPDPTPLSLMHRWPVSKSSAVLRFSLPDTTKPLNLPTCACILAHTDVDGETVTRPYTPITTTSSIGSFDLLVKNYAPHGKMSRTLHEISPGDNSISFSHSEKNVKIQAADFIDGQVDHIGMLVGGAGITPMIQALHAILGKNSPDIPKVTMLYGTKTSDDILGKELLRQWADDYKDRFTLIDVLSEEPEDSSWAEGVRGFIDKDLISKHFPAADGETKQLVFVCGPPPMYDALCGPRDEKDQIKGALGELGFSAKQVYKF